MVPLDQVTIPDGSQQRPEDEAVPHPVPDEDTVNRVEDASQVVRAGHDPGDYTAVLLPDEQRFRVGPGSSPLVASRVRNALRQLGWTETGGDDWTLCWCEPPPDAVLFEQLAPGMLIVSLPGSELLASKASAATLLARSGATSAVPTTFAMPAEHELLQAAAAASPGTRWVQRPDATSRGVGAVVLERASEAERGGRWVVQELQEAVRTVRLHIVLACVEPIAVYVIDRELQELGDDATTAEGLVARALIAAREPVLRSTWAATPHVRNCAQLLAFDLAIGADAQPTLLEVDLDPLGAPDAPTDLASLLLGGLLDVRWTGDGFPASAGGLRRIFPSGDGGLWQCLTLPRPADVALAERDGLQARHRDALRPAVGVRTWLAGLELVLLVEPAGELIALNPSGAFVWLALTEGLDFDQIADEVIEAFQFSPDYARRSVWNLAGDLVDRGALIDIEGDSPTTAARQELSRASLCAPDLGWNRASMYRCARRTVSVYGLPARCGELLDGILIGTPSVEAGEIDARIELARIGSGWRLTGTHIGPSSCPTDNQLVPLARSAVLTSVARAAPGTAFVGSALAGRGRAAVVFGSAERRRALIAAWLEAGEGWLADDLIGLTPGGDAIEPAAVSLAEQIELWPAPWPEEPADVLIDLDGWIVRFAAPPIMSWEARSPLPVGALVILTDDAEASLAPISPAAALDAALDHRVLKHDKVTIAEAESLVGLVRGADCFTAGRLAPDTLVPLLMSKIVQ